MGGLRPASADRDIGLFEVRRRRNQAHRTGQGVGAEQGALRPAQDLDAFHVHQPRVGVAVDLLACGGGGHFPEVGGHGRRRPELTGADAADLDAVAGRAGVFDVDAWEGVQVVAEFTEPPCFDLLAADSGNRQRNVLHRLAALGGRDQDLFEHRPGLTHAVCRRQQQQTRDSANGRFQVAHDQLPEICIQSPDAKLMDWRRPIPLQGTVKSFARLHHCASRSGRWQTTTACQPDWPRPVRYTLSSALPWRYPRVKGISIATLANIAAPPRTVTADNSPLPARLPASTGPRAMPAA